VNQAEKKVSGEEGNKKEAVMEILEPLLQLNENRPLAEEEKAPNNAPN